MNLTNAYELHVLRMELLILYVQKILFSVNTVRSFTYDNSRPGGIFIGANIAPCEDEMSYEFLTEDIHKSVPTGNMLTVQNVLKLPAKAEYFISYETKLWSSVNVQYGMTVQDRKIQ
jgi:hypothetical protein